MWRAAQQCGHRRLGNGAQFQVKGHLNPNIMATPCAPAETALPRMNHDNHCRVGTANEPDLNRPPMEARLWAALDAIGSASRMRGLDGSFQKPSLLGAC